MVMADPPSEPAVNEIEALPLPGVAEREVGAVGAVATEKAVLATQHPGEVRLLPVPSFAPKTSLRVVPVVWSKL